MGVSTASLLILLFGVALAIAIAILIPAMARHSLRRPPTVAHAERARRRTPPVRP